MKLYDYQIRISDEAVTVLRQHGLVYLAMQMRTGKTSTALTTAEKYGAQNVLVLTPKKAIDSIKGDYDALGSKFNWHITNYEQVHNLSFEPDLVIIDEAHKLGQFPRPSARLELIREICKGLPVIFLSGTPTPESYCQVFHQLYVSSFSPWKRYKNFYSWAKHYVYVETFEVNGFPKNDYSMSKGHTVERLEKEIRSMEKTMLATERRLQTCSEDERAGYQKDLEVATATFQKKSDELATVKAEIQEKIDRIKTDIKPYFITYTQQEAGFNFMAQEEIIRIPVEPGIHKLVARLRRDKLYIGKNDEQKIIADTAVKLQQKLHQIYSGTVILDNEEAIIMDRSKARYIAKRFKGQKIAIFYKFRAEYLALKCEMDNLTDDIQRFNEDPAASIALQFVSGREGTNLSKADALVFYNIDFSAVSYFQARERTNVKNRETPPMLYWIFAEGGIEDKIYNVVQGKTDYTLSHFRKDYPSLKHQTLQK